MSVARISLAPVVALLLALTGCAGADGPGTNGSGTDGSGADSSDKGREVRPPRADEAFDYQLGGAYEPPAGVRTVIRDRTADPAPGAYNICYVNAYQAQPDAVAWWQRNHPELLLRDADGASVVDEEWQEPLLDISTEDRRDRLAHIVGGWIDGCAERGFDAVEADNLDSYLRSDGLLDRRQAAGFARLLAERAHRAGLAIGQKNAVEMSGLRDTIGFDFAVAEECARYDECGRYADTYDDRVLVIEYRPTDFTVGCREWGDRLAIVLRDRDVVPAGEPGHRNARC
ncbi:endo alpha-1,4 polygalactosaminidase [Streptomyces sp. NPDC059743]|uniref:endo alpha-1,4 polygalactosaminidase n=1 Tax=Streptomyces sp. NPDC059743 TaxID=3346928 RepID=UPI0036568622